jgi:Rha family phage regulatory protein
VVTDSRAVALAFGKRHKNVLRTIERMHRSGRDLIARHARLNFEPCSYAGQNGKQEPMYRMTAKGLSELAMGFSGDALRRGWRSPHRHALFEVLFGVQCSQWACSV